MSRAAAAAPPRSAAAVGAAPIEPVLEMQDIQGIAVPGFFKPHQTLIYVGFTNSRTGLLSLRAALRSLLSEVSTASSTLNDRREHRGADKVVPKVAERVFMAMGFPRSACRD